MLYKNVLHVNEIKYNNSVNFVENQIILYSDPINHDDVL